MTEQEIRRQLEQMRKSVYNRKVLHKELKDYIESKTFTCNYDSLGTSRTTISDKTSRIAEMYEARCEQARKAFEEEEERFKALYEAIAMLPTDLRVIIIERYKNGKTLRCIAVSNFCNHVTIINKIDRAVAMISKFINKE